MEVADLCSGFLPGGPLRDAWYDVEENETDDLEAEETAGLAESLRGMGYSCTAVVAEEYDGRVLCSVCKCGCKVLLEGFEDAQANAGFVVAVCWGAGSVAWKIGYEEWLIREQGDQMSPALLLLVVFRHVIDDVIHVGALRISVEQYEDRITLARFFQTFMIAYNALLRSGFLQA